MNNCGFVLKIKIKGGVFFITDLVQEDVVSIWRDHSLTFVACSEISQIFPIDLGLLLTT